MKCIICGSVGGCIPFRGEHVCQDGVCVRKFIEKQKEKQRKTKKRK